MPRTARASVGGVCYHVINRGNARQEVFHQHGDYEAFLKVVSNACDRAPMRILAFCIMPNHFHLVLWPENDGDLSHWMQWLLTAHVRRYHRYYQSDGHVWQGRFKAFPIEQDEHLLAVLRYVERNPLRAKLVSRSEEWPWSSFAGISRGKWSNLVSESPVPKGAGWSEWVNAPEKETELLVIRNSIERGSPYGSAGWKQVMAQLLGLESSLHPRGRPRK